MSSPEELLDAVVLRAQEAARGLFHADPDTMLLTVNPFLVLMDDELVSEIIPVDLNMGVTQQIQNARDKCAVLALVDTNHSFDSGLEIVVVAGTTQGNKLTISRSQEARVGSIRGPYPGVEVGSWKRERSNSEREPIDIAGFKALERMERALQAPMGAAPRTL